jgi:two-component system sensor histidine kinase GlrK
MSLLKLTIFKRLVIGYLLIILLVVATGFYTTLRLNKLNETIRVMNAIDVQAIRITREIAQAVYIQIGFEKKYLISGDRDFEEQFEKMNLHLDEKMAELEKIAATPELKSLSQRIKRSHGRYRLLFNRIVSMENPQKVILERDKVISDIEFSIRKIADLSDKARNEKLQLSEQISNQIVKAIAVTETAAIILIILISFLITRSINRPIRLLREKTKMTAGGEFGQPLEITSPPEISELAASFNSMCARLKELDQMKIDFISHLSHELRTPLTAIKEASSMLMEGIFSQFPEKQQELFDIVNGECERLIKTVSRTLDLSRMEAGMAQFQFESADLNPIIERIGAKLSPIAQRKMIDLKLNIPEGIPILKIDEEKIGQVIENLLGNALNYTPEGGEIFISLCRNWEKNTVEVSVSDTGCGIPREHLKEIFEKFKRVDDRKGSVRGTGLGLAIAKHIINAHGGSIWAESEAGKGSTFIFSLPLQSVSS